MESKPFFVGLCMAGAVSAGAYTAGVMDYLIEALNDWESMRNQSNAPQHRVKIPVIGGASAGGMTGIITASAINNPIVPVRSVPDSNIFTENPLNKLYHTWVDLIAADIFPLLLETDDITETKIPSLLNSKFIDKIAQKALQVDPHNWITLPFFETNLKVFTTLTSLRGLSYDVYFRGAATNKDKYCINSHNDYACFELNTTNYNGNGWIPLDFKTGLSKSLAMEAAMGTGAFPVGLQPRWFTRKSEYINENRWMSEITKVNPIDKPEFKTLVVDGGMINNEPFEKVRNILTDITKETKEDYNNYNRFSSTILMIDPFPSIPPEFLEKDSLLPVVGSTLSALINQARIKPETIADAIDSDCAGQYLIAPTRKVPQANGGTKEEMGFKAISCGALSGFGGFLNKEFRIHDFFLGRANCEKFLRDHFTVPAESTNIITQGYAHLSDEEKTRFYSTTDSQKSLQIIPIFTPRKDRKYLPVFSSGMDWPVIKEDQIERFRGKIKNRVDSLIMNLADYGAITKILLKIGGWVLLNRKLAGVAMDSMKKSLEEHQLLKK
jgi:hypothetical protein